MWETLVAIALTAGLIFWIEKWGHIFFGGYQHRRRIRKIKRR